MSVDERSAMACCIRALSAYVEACRNTAERNLMQALSLNGVNEGTQREAFFVNQLSYQHRIEYASSQADFLVDGKYTFEVGGKSKDGKQIAGVTDSFIAADGIEHPFDNKIPLWCFGLLY